MNYKKICAAVAAACGLAGAHAQSSVTAFGLLDLGVARLSSSAAHVMQLAPDGNQTSRLGFQGREDLGDGMYAAFWIEAQIGPDSGIGTASSPNNQATTPTCTVAITTTTITTRTPPVAGSTTTSASTSTSTCSTAANGSQGITFNRRSTVSLGGKWGEVRLGRDYTPTFRSLVSFSPFGTNGVGSSLTLFTAKTPTGGATQRTSTRASNSIGYVLPANLGGFYGEAMVAMGENASNTGVNQDDGDYRGVRVGWKGAGFNVAAATGRTDYTPGDYTQSNAGISYEWNAFTISYLWGLNKIGATKTTSQLLGLQWKVGRGEARFAYGKAKPSGFTGGQATTIRDATHWAVGYVYDLSKRTALYADYAVVSNKGAGTSYDVGIGSTPGGSTRGMEFGIRHSF